MEALKEQEEAYSREVEDIPDIEDDPGEQDDEKLMASLGVAI